MALQSKLFRGDPKLEAALVSDPAHILQGARGDHVVKIQQALVQLDGASISTDGAFGPGTAAAVGAFKTKRNILNTQGKIDHIVGKKTMAALDAEMNLQEQAGGPVAGGSRVGFAGGIPGLGAVNHTLFYFSGLSSNPALHGALLVGGLREDVQIEMEDKIDVKPDTHVVFGFGGSPINLGGVMSAALLAAARDPRGKLIIYGFSSGGINALDLCRQLKFVGTKVDLLVTVDVTDGSLLTEAPVDPVVPDNVDKNRNYFQRTISTIPIPRGIRTTPTKPDQVEQIDCTKRPFSKVPRPFGGKNNHGQMETMTHFETIDDMRKALKTK